MGLPDRCKGALKKITTRCCESCFAVGNPTTGLRGSPFPITPVLVVRSPFCKGPNPLKGDGFSIFLLKDFLLGLEKKQTSASVEKGHSYHWTMGTHTHTHTHSKNVKKQWKGCRIRRRRKDNQSGNQTHQKTCLRGFNFCGLTADL